MTQNEYCAQTLLIHQLHDGNQITFYLLHLDNWLKANKLHLNIDKICYSVFSPNKISVPTVTIKVNDMKIKCVKECKYLGIIIDDELKWTPHIDSVLQKLKRLLVFSIKCIINCVTGAYTTFICICTAIYIIWSRNVWQHISLLFR